MNEILDRSVWINFFNEFSKRNQSRITQLDFIGLNGAQKEEHGLLFRGISLERGNGLPDVEIVFDDRDREAVAHLTRVIENVQRITPKRDLDGCDEALAIVNAHGETSLLRFESRGDVALA